VCGCDPAARCRIADILNAYTQRVARDGSLGGLRAYSAARPPHAEGLAVGIAGYLAQETACPGINLLHLSSRKAVEAALALPRVFPHLDVRRAVTVNPQLSTGFPVSPGYPHVGDKVPGCPNSWGSYREPQKPKRCVLTRV